MNIQPTFAAYRTRQNILMQNFFTARAHLHTYNGAYAGKCLMVSSNTPERAKEGLTKAMDNANWQVFTNNGYTVQYS